MSLFSIFYKSILWPIYEKRNGMSTKNGMSFLASSEKWTREQIDIFQWNRTRFILNHAYEHSSFYRNRFDKIGLKPDDIRSFKDYEQIPCLSRQDLNEHLETIIADNILEDDRHYASTGGSTGLPTRFVRDNECLDIKLASEYRFNAWCGWSPGEKILYYWPALTDFSNEPVKFEMAQAKLYSRRLKLYSGRLNEQILSQHIAMFKRFRPQIVRAFPGALQRFAEYVEQTGQAIPAVKSIISVGESLHESQKEIFKRVFGADVFNCYVSRECGNIACECSLHDGLHIAEELLYLEISKNDKSDYGNILITDLWNMGMPFIRYQIQDAARWVETKCPCGKSHKLLGVDAGRLSDFLVSPVDGSYVSGSTLTHYLLAEGPKMGRVKLIQLAPNKLKVMITGNEENYNAAKMHINARLNTIFEGKMLIDFQHAETIPLLASGKFSVVERHF